MTVLAVLAILATSDLLALCCLADAAAWEVAELPQGHSHYEIIFSFHQNLAFYGTYLDAK